MDSVLELDPVESRYLKETITRNRELFVQIAPQLFEDCFHLLLSSGAKNESFNLIKQL
jgi:hypothetical protein